MAEDKPGIEERKRELEEELDRYAQAGVASPGVVKASRWLSRFLYLGMAVLVFYLLFSGWGKVSKQDFEAVIGQNDKLKDQLKNEKAAAQELQDLVSEAVSDQLRIRGELETLRDPARAADTAISDIRSLVDRAYGERAYAAHWREKLAAAQPDAHGIAPVEGVKQLLRQAATEPVTVQFESLRETADFGDVGCREGARAMLDDPSPQVRAVAGRLLARVGGHAELLAEKAKAERDAATARELWFAWSLLAAQPPANVWTPEAWVGYTISRFNAPLDELAAAYKKAPETSATGMLALLAAAAGRDSAPMMTEIAANTGREDVQRIIAVRWFAERKVEEGQSVLQGLARGKGPVATEAAQALKALAGD